MSTRRQFLSRIAMTTAAVAAERALRPFVSLAHARAGNPLRFPRTLEGAELVAERVSAAIWPERPTTVWTFGGTFPGPTVRVQRGEELHVRLVNRLDEPTNIHWHGLLAPAMMDGHPMHVVAPGASREYRFTVEQRAGTYWYHPHAHMLTAKQAYLGMAGFVIVEDPDEAALGLPTGERDIPLVLQDRRVDASRVISYAPTMMDEMSGLLGSVLLVNGTPDAYHEVSRDLYRVRVLNGSNARVYRLGLDDGATFLLIGSDGGLLDRPYAVTELMLSPGERVELLLDFRARAIGSSATLRSLPYDNAVSPMFQGYPFDIVRFDVVRESATGVDVPSQLFPLEPVEIAGAPTRTLRLAMVHMHPAMAHTINGEVYDMERVDARVAPGSTEVWELVNEDNDEPHPMHLHGARFQVLERGGSTELLPEDRGWKDTVRVEPIETVKVAVSFAEHEGLFVAHCHNLEHEDSGMMINFAVGSTAEATSDDEACVGIIAVTPNPSSEHVRVRLAAREAGHLVVALYAVDGRAVRTEERHVAVPGEVAVDFELAGLASATYLVRATMHAHDTEAVVTVVR